MATSVSLAAALKSPEVSALTESRTSSRRGHLWQQANAHRACERYSKACGGSLVCRAALAGTEIANAPSQSQHQSQPHSQSQSQAEPLSHSQPQSQPQPRSSDSGHDQRRLEQEWARRGLPAITREIYDAETGAEWPSLSLSLPFPPSGAPGVLLSHELETLDEVWFCLGLADAVTMAGTVTVPDSVTVHKASPATDTVTVPDTVTVQSPTSGAVEVWPASEAGATAAATPAAPEDNYFASDARPVVLFDGACNFCSKWAVFLLDTDLKGNLRFASMQSEAGRNLLRKAGMKDTDTSEVVLAARDRSYIGTDAILQIFARLAMPFPLVAALGSLTPSALNTAVYKTVSKYRHRFGGPAACRLFDARFSERFLS